MKKKTQHFKTGHFWSNPDLEQRDVFTDIFMSTGWNYLFSILVAGNFLPHYKHSQIVLLGNVCVSRVREINVNRLNFLHHIWVFSTLFLSFWIMFWSLKSLYNYQSWILHKLDKFLGLALHLFEVSGRQSQKLTLS